MADPRYTEPVLGLSPEELPAKLRAAIDAARRELPEGAGVVLFAFDFGQERGVAYISNAHREDAVRMVLEWARLQLYGRNARR